MINIDLSKKSWQWIVLIVLAFIWGTSFILMKWGLRSYTSMQVAAMRVFFSFLFVLPFSFKHLKKVNSKNLKSLLIAGFIGIALPAMFFTKAETRIDSSLAGMLNSLTPLWTSIIGIVIYKSTIKGHNVVGLIIGFAGATGLMAHDFSAFFSSFNSYALLVVLATLCYGINVNEIKFHLKNLSAVEITVLSFVFTGPIAGIYLLFSDYSYTINSQGKWLDLFFVALLALFSSVIAVVIFNKLIKHTTSIFAASVTYIIPIFAIFWGVIDGEKFLTQQIVWIAIILFGVHLVNKK